MPKFAPTSGWPATPRPASAIYLLLLLALIAPRAGASGIYRHGAGARAMALGGASVAAPVDPLAAMHSNPAGLGLTNQTALHVGFVGAVAGGEFSNAANTNGPLREKFGALPEIALVHSLESVPLSLGVAVIPEALASADWRFTDAPGGLDGNTSYGAQRHFAEIITVRAAFGASWRVNDQLVIGASLGATYDRNRLIAPYTFQSNPQLRGFKTLLDLETEGWGVNGGVGLVWRPCDQLSLGLSYRSMTDLETRGDANGNAATQLQNIGAGSFRPDFHYDATVNTKLPQIISAGAAWRAGARWNFLAQVDWINWSDSFDALDIRLANGDNADINGFLGTDRADDVVPLGWRDRFVFRGGVEFMATDAVTLRGGYAYGESPVPTATLTPMSAAILEHTVTAGAEWRRGRWTLGAAYQYSFPSTANVGASGLVSGEYSGSRTEVQAHWFGLTAGLRF
jgi:long-chain fatty acid transport protein